MSDYWQGKAECADSNPAIFFSDETVDEARSICLRCPVRRECGDDAIDRGEEHGVWGGMAPEQLEEIRRDPITGEIRRKCYLCDDWATGKSRFCDPCRAKHRANFVRRYDAQRRVNA